MSLGHMNSSTVKDENDTANSSFQVIIYLFIYLFIYLLIGGDYSSSSSSTPTHESIFRSYPIQPICQTHQSSPTIHSII